MLEKHPGEDLVGRISDFKSNRRNGKVCHLEKRAGPIHSQAREVDPWRHADALLEHASEMESRQLCLGCHFVQADVFSQPGMHQLYATTFDRLSGQRLVLGLASGDRQAEFPAFNTDIEKRGELFRETLAVARQAWSEDFPTISTERVKSVGADTIPKPLGRNIPVLVTGKSRQSVDWIAQHGDGWLYYPQEIGQQARTVQTWRSRTPTFKPFAQSLYIDLTEDPNKGPTPIPLGFRAGHRFITDYFGSLEKIGVNHVGINLKYGTRPAHEVVQELGENVVPHFPSYLRQVS